MARPRKGTEGHEEAKAKWLNTMYSKYGKDGLHKLMSENGAKGGRNGHRGGFAANPELARRAGSLGGKRSKRGPAKKLNDNI